MLVGPEAKKLLDDINRKDHHFRLASIVFAAAVLMMLGWIIVADYQLESENHALLTNQTNTLAGQKKAVASLTTNNDKKLSDLQNHIDCIVSLFQQPNRANLTITDLQNCQLTQTGSSGGATGGTKSGITNGSPAASKPAPSNHAGGQAGSTPPGQSTNPSPGPKPPSHPLLCKITLGLLGCTKAS